MLIVYLCLAPPAEFSTVLQGTSATRTFLQRLRQENFATEHPGVIVFYNESAHTLIEACIARHYTLRLYGLEVIRHGLPRYNAHVSQWIEAAGHVVRNYTGQLSAEVESALGVLDLKREDLNEASVNKQYRALALQHHPDKGGRDPAAFVRLTAAREVLLKHLATLSNAHQ
jgi:hypothetical protein